MNKHVTRRGLLAAATALAVSMAALGSGEALAADKVKLRLSSVNSETDQRAVALLEKFGPAIAEFAEFEPHWNGALFKQGTELEAIARGNLEMSIASAQELAVFFPEFSIFTAGYVHRDAAHQVAVFNNELMEPFKKKVEDELGVKLLTVMYLGRRQVNLRTDQEVKTPEDLAGVKLRMPGTDAWQFLGKALGASPVPMAFTEVYTALQTGAVDGQDNPLPTVVDAKFYEVTKQIVLTSHLVDLNYLALSKKVWESLTPDQQATLQKAADEAAEFGRQNQLKKEEELVSFLKEKGLRIYEPDLGAFRSRVQKMYQDSDFAKDWPAGLIDKINAL
ncbi:sialic acid TRAP transporter substrate-binding protein SiaP [Polymorphum gilvum]|uniref:TRAP dicarboxylate transporter-DctP subunit n=1 Tax=Polymorphum gilvum (strain LMG 25793 / CGMCC 1.9160 / SL003B-26A1) TaxID=991905 RepID=F2IXI5_POLGS|nr:sialic acid TRAP transporter substrate-binding protein SiaP [Polymorphum gilvum]ADZ71608.1 TRAP dicarboxylate transporter-DctP subunit [Polymorphum gilvum SL003B-26A1]